MSKTIGLIVAMDKELFLFVDDKDYSFVTEKKNGNFEYHIGQIAEDIILVIAKSGIGKVNSALCTATMINEYHPDYIISSGVCGSVRTKGVVPGDFVIADKVRYHDVWCGKPNLLGQVQDMPEEFECKHINIQNINYPYTFHRGLMISGDWFVDDSFKAFTLSGFDSNGIDMESGSIAQTCYRYNVPFVSVRIVSDAVLNPEAKTYDEFWTYAPTKLNKVVISIIKNC